MKSYLIDFFKCFDYEKEDSEFLLSVYDKICENPDAASALNTVIELYSKDHRTDYKRILELAEKIASLCDVHEYTSKLLVFICLSKRLKELYAERGLSEEIFHDSMLDLKYKLKECKLVKGIRGSFVANWFAGFFELTRFALGRLQFEVKKLGCNYSANGITLTPESKIINVHIPRTETPLDKESCDASYERAREFFKNEVEEPHFICSSWLLYPKNLEILSPKSNVYRFLSEFDIISSSENDGADLWRIFDTDEKDPDKLPADSFIRRAYIEHIKKGGKLGRGEGIKI